MRRGKLRQTLVQVEQKQEKQKEKQKEKQNDRLFHVPPEPQSSDTAWDQWRMRWRGRSGRKWWWRRTQRSWEW